MRVYDEAQSVFPRGGAPTRYPARGATRRHARARPLASRARGIVAQSTREPEVEIERMNRLTAFKCLGRQRLERQNTRLKSRENEWK